MTNNALTFEQATVGEIDFIVAKTIALHQFETANNPENLEISDLFEEKIHHWISIELTNSASLIFIIKVNNEPIGFAFLKVQLNQTGFTNYPAHGLIQSIWIDPEYRLNKIGRKIILFIESIFKEQNIPYYEVSFSATNQTAEKFWLNCGLKISSKSARKFL